MGKERIATLASIRMRIPTMAFWGQKTETSKHSPTCAWRKSQNRRKIAGQFNVAWTRALGVQVAVSLTYTFGAGGFSISPNLELKYIVEHDPARDLVERLFWNDLKFATSLQDADKQVARTERRILQLFQGGQSSPHFRDSDGSTLMHVSSLDSELLHTSNEVVGNYASQLTLETPFP